jgi:hypothetical protein
LYKIGIEKLLRPFKSLYLWKDVRKHAHECITEIDKVDNRKNAKHGALVFLKELILIVGNKNFHLANYVGNKLIIDLDYL